MRKYIEYESLKETVDEANEIISELNEENEKLNDKIIDLSADLGFFQNENIHLTEDIEKYWQLEEELRCPLEVVFKALEEGITDKKDFDYYCARLYKSQKGYRFEIAKPTFCQIDGDEYPKEYDYFYLKDYKRTWWLKGEKDVKED